MADTDPADGPGTRILWAVRGASVERTFGGGDLDGLPARGVLGSRLRQAVESGRIELHTQVAISALEPNVDGAEVTVVMTTPAGQQRLVVDVIAAATGFRPDLVMLRELRLDLDPGVEAPARLAPLIDPEFHSCGTVAPHGADVLAHPERGFFIAGMKSYGRAPTFLLATGYEQVRSISAHLAGDAAAAADVRLDLPETGVCSTSIPAVAAGGRTETDDDVVGSCCGTSEPQPISIGVGATDGARLGFPTGFQHGRAAEIP
ncbi:hypothetical protein ACFEMC_10425 [Kineococcus sp. DHX-1]|uniref:hypothetical protein n=1 Tax=Kineococcus sp. DHX-1 TaxID=3349638 RepID=UPI0036D27613